MNSELVIKISFEGKIKRMSPNDYQSFYSLIKKSFGQLNDEKFQISYIDDENDKIDVDCQDDFAYAIDYAKKRKIVMKFLIERTPIAHKLKLDNDNVVMPELLLSFEAMKQVDDKPITCNRCKETYPTFKQFDDHEWKCQLNYNNSQIIPSKNTKDTVRTTPCPYCSCFISEKNYLKHIAKCNNPLNDNKNTQKKQKTKKA